VLLDARNAEEVGLTAERDYEVVVRELEPAVDVDLLVFVVDPVELRPPEASSGGDERAPERLGNIAGVYIAADDPRDHRPESKEVVLGENEHADILAVFCVGGELFSRCIAAEAAAHDEHLVLKLLVPGLLPGSVPRLWVERSLQRP